MDRLRGRGLPLALVAFALVVLVVQLTGLTDRPTGYYLDESSFSWNAWSLVTTGADEHGRPWPIFFESFGDWKTAPYIYLLAAVFAVTGPSILAARVVSASAGVAAVAFMGALAYRMTGRPLVAVLTAAMTLLLPWTFEPTRLAMEVALMPALVGGFLLALHARPPGSSRWSIVLLAAILALLTYTYTLGRLLGPLLALGLRRLRQPRPLARGRGHLARLRPTPHPVPVVQPVRAGRAARPPERSRLPRTAAARGGRHVRRPVARQPRSVPPAGDRRPERTAPCPGDRREHASRGPRLRAHRHRRGDPPLHRRTVPALPAVRARGLVHPGIADARPVPRPSPHRRPGLRDRAHDPGAGVAAGRRRRVRRRAKGVVRRPRRRGRRAGHLVPGPLRRDRAQPGRLVRRRVPAAAGRRAGDRGRPDLPRGRHRARPMSTATGTAPCAALGRSGSSTCRATRAPRPVRSS